MFPWKSIDILIKKTLIINICLLKNSNNKYMFMIHYE
jgi:hypothetical protein